MSSYLKHGKPILVIFLALFITVFAFGILAPILGMSGEAPIKMAFTFGFVIFIVLFYVIWSWLKSWKLLGQS